MTTPHIVSVRSNIKGKTPDGWLVNSIGPKTVVSGPVGSGKTAFVTAVELALTGSATDVRFKDPKSEAVLLALAPAKATKLFSEVTFSDGTVATWEMNIVDGKAKKAQHKPGWLSTSTSVMPFRVMKALLEMTPDRAMAALVQALPAQVLDIAGVHKALSTLDKRTRPYAQEIIDACSGSNMPKNAAQLWTYIYDQASRRKLDADAAARGAEAQSTRSTEHAGVLSDEEFAGLEEELRQSRFAQLAREFFNLAEWIAEHPEAPEAPPADPPEVEPGFVEPLTRAMLTAMQGVTLAQAAKAKKLTPFHCPWCLRNMGPLGINHVADTLEHRANAMLSHESGHAEYAEKLELWNTANDTYARVWEQLEAQGVDPATFEWEPYEVYAERANKWAVLSSRTAEARALRDAVGGAKQAAKTLGKDMREEASRWKELTEAAAEKVRESATAQVSLIENAVTPWLPNKWRLKLILELGGSPVFMPTVDKGDGRFRPAFSGMEGQAVVTALAVAFAPQTYACIIPDDRDRGNELDRWMATLTGAAPQVFLTTAAGYVPSKDGWTTVDTTNLLR